MEVLEQNKWKGRKDEIRQGRPSYSESVDLSENSKTLSDLHP